MSTIINGTSSAITFPDSSVQNTSAIVSGYVPYANLPAGSVLQVVNATYSTQVSNSTNTYSDTGLTASITPKFATSKILVIVDLNGIYKTTNDTSLKAKIVRNSSDLIVFSQYSGATGNGNFSGIGSCSASYSDSPATTSATIYKVQFLSDSNNAIVYCQAASVANSTITLMEIAG